MLNSPSKYVKIMYFTLFALNLKGLDVDVLKYIKITIKNTYNCHFLASKC